MCDVLIELIEDELKKEYDKGRSEEQINDVCSLIKTCRKFAIQKDKAVSQLMEYYSLSREVEEKYANKYWM